MLKKNMDTEKLTTISNLEIKSIHAWGVYILSSFKLKENPERFLLVWFGIIIIANIINSVD